MVSISNIPPIPAHRKSVYEYYRLTFDKYGCPMKQTESGMVFHPILAAYLIIDLVTLFEKTGENSFLQHAQAVATHALNRAEHLNDALIFLYSPDTGLSSVPQTFYSALTQAWYVKSFCALEKHFPEEYQEEIGKFFRSLTVPCEESGVLMKKDYGWIVEEYPHEPAFYTLNGWLTVLRWIVQCRKMLDSIGIQYGEFLERNLDAVEHLLPLYDASFCLNSRYQLTGYSRIKIVFDKPVAYKCLGFEIEIPGEGRFAGTLDFDKKSRWKNYLERSEDRLLQFNVLLSLISKPEPNVFRVRLKANKACKGKIHLAQGSYRPDISGMPTERWKELQTISLSPDTEIEIECPIPFDGENLFAYPTNFKKKINGLMYNGYHFVHIVDLADLYAYSRRSSLKLMARRWLQYINKWNEFPVLRNDMYSLKSHIYGDNLNLVVKKILHSRSRNAK